eukprot:g2977.t1
MSALPTVWVETSPASELAELERRNADAFEELYDPHRFLREGERVHHCIANGPMSHRHVSVALKHHYAWGEVARAAGAIQAALILEDDVIFSQGFRTRLDAYIAMLAARNGCECAGAAPAPAHAAGAHVGAGGWDLLSVGAGNPEMHAEGARDSGASWGVHARQWSGQGSIFEVGAQNVMRSCEAYVVSVRGATRLWQRMLPLAFPIDNQMNYLLNTMERAAAGAAAVFWAEPTIASQGSLSGAFQSGVQGHNSYWPPAVRVRHFQRAVELGTGHRHHSRLQAELGVALCAAGRHDDAGAILARAAGPGRGVRARFAAQLERAAQRYSRAGEVLQAVEYLLAAQLVLGVPFRGSSEGANRGTPVPPPPQQPLRFVANVARDQRDWAGTGAHARATRAAVAAALLLAARHSPEIFAAGVTKQAAAAGLESELHAAGGVGGSAQCDTDTAVAESDSDVE